MGIQLFILLMLCTQCLCRISSDADTLISDAGNLCSPSFFFHDSFSVKFINFIDFFNGAIFAFVGIFYSLFLFFINLHSNLCHFHGFAIR